MYQSGEARELSILLRISSELDIVGDVTATVESPSELLAWADLLADNAILAWRAEDSGNRYIQVTARRRRAPVHGQVAAVLPCEQHREFWDEILTEDLKPGTERPLTRKELADAWTAMPVIPPE